jgi:hypothetical protein
MTEAKENGHEIWYVECKKPAHGMFAQDGCERKIKIYVKFSGSTGGQIGQGGTEPTGK